MSKKKQYKDVIGLIHPDSNWHEDSKELLGAEIEIKEILPALSFPGWYAGSVRLINPPDSFMSVANNMSMRCFRPRSVLVK